MKKIKRIFNIVTLFFLLLSIGNLIAWVKDYQVLKDMKDNGVRVNATIVDVVLHSGTDDTPDRDVYFRYEYDGKEYTHVYFNYPGGSKIGKTVSGYIDPDDPGELYLSTEGTSGFFAVFLFALAVFSGVVGYKSLPSDFEKE